MDTSSSSGTSGKEPFLEVTNVRDRANHSDTGKVALFWDESFIWGLIAYDTFSQLTIDFDIVTSSDIRSGALKNYDIIFVPGGWASNKIKALGETGAENIRAFVRDGGSYLGFCGGAGLALSHRDGLALIPATRKPTSERVPSFSGRIKLNRKKPAHRIWKGLSDTAAFHAWWPGQFHILEQDNLDVLAIYDEPEGDAYVADIPVDPLVDWDSWERSYKTNLNPGRIKGEPAVIETAYGKGKVLLSYLHFETPGDEDGHKVLLNICEYLAGKNIVTEKAFSQPENPDSPIAASRITDRNLLHVASELEAMASDLIAFGQRHFLWYWRTPWILQWQRGVRGIEYCTIYTMLKRLSALALKAGEDDLGTLAAELLDLKDFSQPFFSKAKQLLILERFAMNDGPITPLTSNDSRIQLIREELFSGTKSFGGYFKQIIDRIDALLVKLLIATKS